MADRMRLLDRFNSPDDVGSSEYRAIYDCIADALFDANDEDAEDMVRSMLQAFSDAVQDMQLRFIEDENGYCWDGCEWCDERRAKREANR
jgi:hypothetical protein